MADFGPNKLMKPNLIVILGPTASGKTKLAAQLAHALHTEIISADSRQVYRNMNIGTGKDYAEYEIDSKKIPTHLIDNKDAGTKYHVNEFKEDFYAAFDSVLAKNKVPILCGGTGLYINAILSDFEFTSVPNNATLRAALEGKTREELLAFFTQMPRTAFTDKADTSTAKRLIRAIEISDYLSKHTFEPTKHTTIYPLIFGLNPPTTIRRKKIADRLQSRLQNGLIEEVKQLLTYIPAEQLIYYGLEYKLITLHLLGKLTLPELQQQLTTAIQQFAKRQMTYFRKMERDGKQVDWIDNNLSDEAKITIILDTLKGA